MEDTEFNHCFSIYLACFSSVTIKNSQFHNNTAARGAGGGLNIHVLNIIYL